MANFQSTLSLLVALSGFVVAAVGTNLLQAATVRLGIDTLIANILGNVFACVLKRILR